MIVIRNVDHFSDVREGIMTPVIGKWRECRHEKFDYERTIEGNSLTFKATCVECGSEFHGLEARKLMERG